jgi:hypothetical protein
MVLSITLTSFPPNIIALEEKEEEDGEYTYLAQDYYAKNYDENYFKDNALKINAINNITKENNILLAKQDLAEDKDLDASRLLNSQSKIGFVLPTFTMAAYDNSFYTFFSQHPDVKSNEFVTTDIDLLTATLPSVEESFNSYKALGLHQLRDFTSPLLPKADLTYLADQDIHNGFIFAQDGSNFYDILVLGHSEYVTHEEYYNLKKFVENGGTIILLDSNTFYAEIDYDPIANKISLVKGHYWAFDGEKAWRDVKERWADETTEWVGNNFGCGSSCEINFNNNPFSYVHHEENYVTNPNVKILIDYEAQSTFNYLIVAHELKYGHGKVISLGIFGSDIVDNNNFLRFFEDIIFSIV